MQNPYPFPIGGVKYRSLGEGYMNVLDPHITKNLESDYFPLHAFGSVAFQSSQAKVLAEYNVETPSIPFDSENFLQLPFINTLMDTFSILLWILFIQFVIFKKVYLWKRTVFLLQMEWLPSMMGY